MEIIDFHIHPYLSQENNFSFYKDAFLLTSEEAKDELLAAGITKVCGSVLFCFKYDRSMGFGPIRQLNDEALRIRETYGEDFYIPGFHVHPGFIKDSLEEIRRMKAEGINLVGELVPYLQDWLGFGMKYDAPEFSELLDAIEDNHMVVSFHTIFEQREEINRMVSNHPNITFVAAHPGDKHDYPGQLEAMKKFDNLYLDLSGTGLFRYGMLNKGIRECGSERLLFGTDFPITNPRMYVEAVKGEKLLSRDLENIFSLNSKRILGL